MTVEKLSGSPTDVKPHYSLTIDCVQKVIITTDWKVSNCYLIPCQALDLDLLLLLTKPLNLGKYNSGCIKGIWFTYLTIIGMFGHAEKIRHFNRKQKDKITVTCMQIV